MRQDIGFDIRQVCQFDNESFLRARNYDEKCEMTDWPRLLGESKAIHV